MPHDTGVEFQGSSHMSGTWWLDRPNMLEKQPRIYLTTLPSSLSSTIRLGAPLSDISSSSLLFIKKFVTEIDAIVAVLPPVWIVITISFWAIALPGPYFHIWFNLSVLSVSGQGSATDRAEASRNNDAIKDTRQVFLGLQEISDKNGNLPEQDYTLDRPHHASSSSRAVWSDVFSKHSAWHTR